MTASTKKQFRLENRLLAALPPGQNEALFSHLTPVTLTAGNVLYEPGDRIEQAYFLNRGAASLLSLASEGDAIEVGMVGNEGLLGAPIILLAETAPYRVMLQISGAAAPSATCRASSQRQRAQPSMAARSPYPPRWAAR